MKRAALRDFNASSAEVLCEVSFYKDGAHYISLITFIAGQNFKPTLSTFALVMLMEEHDLVVAMASMSSLWFLV